MNSSAEVADLRWSGARLGHPAAPHVRFLPDIRWNGTAVSHGLTTANGCCDHRLTLEFGVEFTGEQDDVGRQVEPRQGDDHRSQRSVR